MKTTKVINSKHGFNNHAELRASNAKLNQKVKNLASKSEKDGELDPHSNTLSVNMTFHLSIPDKHGNSFEVLPINIPGDLLVGMANNYLYKDHTTMQLEVVQARHDLGFDKKYHKDQVQINGPKHYSASYYQQKFHHSEQALYMYLSERSNLDYLANQLKTRGVLDDTKVTKVVIDMHSIRYVCRNCEIGGFGLLNSNFGFKDNLAKALDNEGIKLNENTKFYIAASADRPETKKKRIEEKEHVAPDLDKLQDGFIQADTEVVPIPNGDTDLHRRTIFISTNLKENNVYNTLGKKYKKAFDELMVDEYSKMISIGRVRNIHEKLNLNMSSNPDDPYSTEDINNITLGFLALAMLETSVQNDRIIAEKILRCRDGYDSEIKSERDGINKVKETLLKNYVQQKTVSELSLKSLQNMKLFVDAQEVRTLIKLIKEHDFIRTSEIYTKDEVKFIIKAQQCDLSIEKNFDLNYSLFARGVSIDKIALLYDYLNADEVEDLYDIIDMEIFHLNPTKLKDFASGDVLRYLTNLNDDDEVLEFDELSDIYNENIDKFWDIIKDPNNVGAQRILDEYAEEEASHHQFNDSGFSDDESDYEYEDLDHRHDIYQNALEKYYLDEGYDLGSYMYEDEY